MIGNIFQLVGSLLTLSMIFKMVGVDIWREVSDNVIYQPLVPRVERLFSDDWFEKFLINYLGEEEYKKRLEQKNQEETLRRLRMQLEEQVYQQYLVKWFGLIGALFITLGYTFTFVQIPIFSSTSVPSCGISRILMFLFLTYALYTIVYNFAKRKAFTQLKNDESKLAQLLL